MNFKQLSFYGIIVVILLSGSLGFISGRQRIQNGNIIKDVSGISFGISNIKVNQNPTDHDMLDIKVDIEKNASENDFYLTAFDVSRKVNERLFQNDIDFEIYRIQVCSGNWKMYFIIESNRLKELENGDISIRSFWVESILKQIPKLEMINSIAKPESFLKRVESLYRLFSNSKENICDFEIKSLKNLEVNLELDNFSSWTDKVSDLVLVIHVVANSTNVYLEKVEVNISNKSSDELIFMKFDYLYLDKLVKNKITTDDFFKHVFVAFK